MINNRKRRGKHAQIKIDKKQQHHELEKKKFFIGYNTHFALYDKRSFHYYYYNY